MGKVKDSGQSPEEIDPFLEPLSSLQRLLDLHQDGGIIIGGIAASLLGRPRLTADIDAMVMLECSELDSFVYAALREGLVPRTPDAVEFARRYRVLLLYHPGSNINIDVSLGSLPFEREAVARSTLHNLGSISIRLPTPEDLIIQKAVAGRPKDMQDIEAIAISHPELDIQRIRYWVEQFAEVMEDPTLPERVIALLDRST